VYPAAVDLGLEIGRQQTGKRPLEAIVGSVSSFDRTVQSGKIRHDSLVRHGRVVERERPDEEPIARNAVCAR
jgi:hypothetical protein